MADQQDDSTGTPDVDVRAVWVGDAKVTPDPAPTVDSEFLERASQRLGWLSLIFTVFMVLVTGINLALHGLLDWTSVEAPLRNASQIAALVLSLAMFAVVWSRRFAPTTVLTLGLVYEVAGAFAIALAAYSDPGFFQERMIRISWVCVWITFFPLVVPNTLVRNLVASLAAASALPVLIVGHVLIGDGSYSVHGVWHAVLPGYICAALALIPAYLIHNLATTASVAKARARELGSYHLTEEVLGQGGMGEVWRAEHRMLARPAAIKLIRPERLEQPERRRRLLLRFEREARAMADLSSPHTVSVYDVGTTDTGEFYYVMELLDGLDLESLVQRFGRVTPARAVHLLRQVCDSLTEAHGVGLVHRDVKPSNITACRLGSECDFVKVLDFGLVTRLHEEDADLKITEEGTVLGSPAFMAPETIRLGAAAVDHRADIYGLGCVAYWLLTGTLVFTDLSQPVVLSDHLRTAPQPLSERLGEELPTALEELILRCLAKDPDDRPQSARELDRELEACLKHTGLWTREDARKWWAKHMSEEWTGIADPDRQSTVTSPRLSASSTGLEG